MPITKAHPRLARQGQATPVLRQLPKSSRLPPHQGAMTTLVGAHLRFTHSVLFVALAAVSAAQQTFTLEEAIASARARRPAFESARQRVIQADMSRRALGAFPATRLFLGYSDPLEVGGSDDDFVLAQPIDVFGRTSAARKSGDALVAQAEATFRQVAADVQNEVVTSYVETVTASELAKSASAILSVYERLHEATRLRVEGGVAPGFHLTQVSLDLEQARLRAERQGAELSSSLARLRALTGAESLSTIEGGFPSIAVSQTDQAKLVLQRPDLLLLAADLRAAEADLGIARKTNLPELEIQGRRTAWQERDDRVGLRLQLSIPLFDYGRAKAERKAASSRVEAQRKALEDATKLALGEAEAARIEVDSATGQVAKYEALVARAKELVERLRPGLTEQATTLIEVLDSTRVLRDVEQSYVEARARLAQAQARYLRATGHILEVGR